MKLKNIVIVVKQMEQAKQFYHTVFGLDVMLDRGDNVMMTEGLVLQEEQLWRHTLGKEILPQSHSCALYFEEKNMASFLEKLESLYPATEYVTPLTTLFDGQQLLRFYDLDGNLIEVRTPRNTIVQ